MQATSPNPALFSTLLLSLILLLAVFAVGCGDPADENGDEEYAERMAEEHEGDVPEPSPAASEEPTAEVETERVVYATVDGEDVTGYLARPVGIESPPGVIVIQEWWGLNDNIEAMARRLAGEGYTALAVDLYGGEVATDRDGAMTLMRAATSDEAALEENLRQAYAYLETEQGAPKIGSIGWCFGGAWSLRTALLFPTDLDAAVIYYGRLVTDPERLGPLEVPILGIFGAEDQGIPVASVREFESALEALGKEFEVHVYEGADHAFANPSGTRYDAEAAEDAWGKTRAFLAKHLGGV